MRWTCPKCGKKLEISNEQLIANDGVIICPQCLLQARQPLPKARVSTRDSKDDTSSKRQTPPPHKPRTKQASTSYNYTGLSGGATSSRKKNTGKKKSTSKKKNNNDGISPLGCFGRTIIFTLVLFAAYVFFGLLIEALQ